MCGSSDHRLILATRYAKNIRQNIRYCRKRSYKDFQEDKFLAEVAKISWWEVYSCNDVDLAVEIFTMKLTAILDKMAPVKKFQIRTKYATRVSDDTKEIMKTRNLAQQTASLTGLSEDWDQNKKTRNEVTGLLRQDKFDWRQSKLKSSDTGKLWKKILGWLNWSSTNSPTKLLSGGKPGNLTKKNSRYSE